MYAHRHEQSGNSILAFLAGAATAVAAGAYFLYGPDGREHRKTLDRGVDRLKREIVARMNELEDITEDTYGTVVDEVLKRYDLAKRLGKTKTARISTALKRRWEEMKDAAERARMDAERELWEEDLEDIRF